MPDERFMRHHYGASGYVSPSRRITELDALLDRVLEVQKPSNTVGRSLRFDEVARDCLRMFEDLATGYKEEVSMRDRYKAQSNSWRDKAFELAEVKDVLVEAVKDAVAFLGRPDITTYEWYKLAPEHIGKFRRAIAKAEESK